MAKTGYSVPFLDKEVLELLKTKSGQETINILVNKYGSIWRSATERKVYSIIESENEKKKVSKRKKYGDVKIAGNALKAFRIYRDEDNYLIKKIYFNGSHRIEECSARSVKTEECDKLTNEILNTMRAYTSYPQNAICKEDSERVNMWRRYIKAYDNASKYIPEYEYHWNNEKWVEFLNEKKMNSSGVNGYAIFSSKMIRNINCLPNDSNFDFQLRIVDIEIDAKKNVEKELKSEIEQEEKPKVKTLKR